MQNMGSISIEVLDSTLRDGAQSPGISFSLEDKIKIVLSLDKLGIPIIEAGNPASNDKDMQLFDRLSKIKLARSKIAAFGSTCRANIAAGQDENCRKLIAADTEIVCVFGKSSRFHAEKILNTTSAENLRMISDTINHMKSHGKTVCFDAEHFFDSYKTEPDYAIEVIKIALKNNADRIVLCDTNGGTFPNEITRIVKQISEIFPEIRGKLGIHCHNDIGCAVANTIEGVRSGITHIQGTLLGFGERCGNANLSAIIPSLQLKLNYECIPTEKMKLLLQTAHKIADCANIPLDESLPFVGKNAFTHKGGMHIDGIIKSPDSFEHIAPDTVGNSRNFLISESSGRTAIANKLGTINTINDMFTKNSQQTRELLSKIKNLESKGYSFESAEASLYLLALKQLGMHRCNFRVESYKIIETDTENNKAFSATAAVKVRVMNKHEITAAEGMGPVNALDKALRKALEVFYPELADVRLINYKVRVLDSDSATASNVRVLIESTDGIETWATIGVSHDIIKASFDALTDSIDYKLRSR